MNTPTQITFPPFQPKLKLARRSADTTAAPFAVEPPCSETGASGASSAPENRAADASESQAPFFHRPGTAAPMQNDLALQTGWEQLKRARALFEDEQKALRERRMALDELEVKLARREASIAAREQVMRERETQAAAERDAAAATESQSVVTKLTRAPFDLARSVFGGGEK